MLLQVADLKLQAVLGADIVAVVAGYESSLCDFQALVQRSGETQVAFIS